MCSQFLDMKELFNTQLYTFMIKEIHHVHVNTKMVEQSCNIKKFNALTCNPSPTLDKTYKDP